MKKRIWLIGTILVVLLLLYLLQENKWNKYYHGKEGQPPREIVERTLQQFSEPGIAIELGCGVGNEAVYMADRGWTVFAVDQQEAAMKFLKERKSPSSTLIPVHADITQKELWNNLPQSDLIFASYALPFVPQKNFKIVWAQLCGKLSSGGRFAGHFFGPLYQGFSSKEIQQMTFLSKNQVLELFQGFEIERFEESEQDDISGTGQATHSHIFEIIARKK